MEEVLGVRGITKTNKRGMKYTGTAKCDFVAVARCSDWVSFCFSEWGREW